MASIHGFDGFKSLRGELSYEEGIAMAAAIRRSRVMLDELMDSLAMKIRNEIVQAWNKGK